MLFRSPIEQKAHFTFEDSELSRWMHFESRRSNSSAIHNKTGLHRGLYYKPMYYKISNIHMSGTSMVGFMDLKNVLTETLMSQENIYTEVTFTQTNKSSPEKASLLLTHSFFGFLHDGSFTPTCLRLPRIVGFKLLCITLTA